MNSFVRLLRAEWTKFRSVRRWVITAVAAAVVSAVASTAFATLSSTDANDYPNYIDQFHFVHQSMAGDGSVVARVASLSAGNDGARAGLMVKQQAVSGSPYAAVYVAPAHGVRLESNFGAATSGGAGGAPTWLRLTRTGSAIAADESADGTVWTRVGVVPMDRLPTTVEIGLFVSSPTESVMEQQFGSTHRESTPTLATATFDHVALTPRSTADWRSDDIVMAPVQSEPTQPGSMTESDGTVTVAGSGDITYVVIGDDDVVLTALDGLLLGLVMVVVLAVLTISSELRRGLIRTTFTASPRRGRALLAKAVVVAAVSFVVGLVGALASYGLARPQLARNGFAAPNYPVLSLTDPTMLRVVVGAGLLLALVGVLGVALGALLRRGAAAITLMLLVFLLPTVFDTALPLDVARWIGRSTPVAGLAILQTRSLWNTATTPWAGLGVLAAYATVVLVLAVWRIRRRDA